MKIFNKIVSWLIIFSLIFPLLAQARAGSSYNGGGRSGIGSYSRPYQAGTYNYRPRTQSPPPYSYQPRPVPAQAYPAPSRSGSFFGGLFSGLAGAWLYNKIFNPGASTTQTQATEKALAVNQASPETKIGFFRIILLLVAAYIIWRIVRRRRGGGNPNLYNQENVPQRKTKLDDFTDLLRGGATQGAVDLRQEDQTAFEELLQRVQNAWSQYNLSELQRLTTPEMYENFAQIIRDNQQRGISNPVSQVRLQNKNVQDTWQENGKDYARVAMTWSALDYAINTALSPNDPGYLVDGDMNSPKTVTEIWTFERSNHNPWLLAGIEQV